MTLLDSFVIYKSTMGGTEMLPVAYLHKDRAEFAASEKQKVADEWTTYEIKPAKLRMVNDNEGAVTVEMERTGSERQVLVSVNRELAKDAKLSKLLTSLSADDRASLKEYFSGQRPDDFATLTYEEIHLALAESLKLQSHYANTMNMYDGGQRMQFPTVRAWIERLKKTGTIKNGP